MKSHTTRRMKIEPFPWLRDYFIDMRKLYAKLTLGKIYYTIFGEIFKIIANYEKMFEPDSDSEDENSRLFKEMTLERNKILTKGEPGVGCDWSRALFKMYSIVFFVHLKLVKPGDSIENVILQQHIELRGLNISPKKLQAMLEKFGDKCLLILDGLDEHGFGKNEDVLKIIRNEKLLDCGLVVSSRPHSINEIKGYFPTIVRVDGFDEKDAERFASHFFTDKNKITQILQFKPSDSREDFPIYQCPILLSFLCCLVSENEIDLSDRNITIGSLYWRMVKCLYKKYTIRKGTSFTESGFAKIMKSVGKLALHTLISNNPLLQRNEVLRIAGEFAFEYGFFAGHEDFKPSSDPTADMCVTYVHRSIEEFFGSYGFIQALDDGKSIDEIFGSVAYTAKRIDFGILDTNIIGQIYPAMNIQESLSDKDNLKVDFFKDVFERCEHVCGIHIVHPPVCEAEVISRLLTPSLLNKLTTISIGESSLAWDISTDLFTILIDCANAESCHRDLNTLLTHDEVLRRNPQVCVRITSGGDLDLGTLIQKQKNHLDLVSCDSNGTLFAFGGFPLCPHFSHFSALGFCIDESVPQAFMKAVKEGKLPNLQRIQLNDCVLSDLDLRYTSTSEWPEIAEFSFETRGKWNLVRKLVLKLTELAVYESSGESLHINHVISTRLENLSALRLGLRDTHNLQCLSEMLKQGKFSNLSELHVENSSEDNIIELDKFLEKPTTVKLQNLALLNFRMSTQELEILSEKLASVQLNELNINRSFGLTGHLAVLLPPAYVVRREGNSFTLFVCPHLGGGTHPIIFFFFYSHDALQHYP